MKKLIMLLSISLIYTSNVFAKDEASIFRLKPHLVVGAGVSAGNPQPLYLKASASLITLGQKNDGAQLMSVGVSYNSSRTELIISPVTMYSNHFAASVDYGMTRIGLSCGYSF